MIIGKGQRTDFPDLYTELKLIYGIHIFVYSSARNIGLYSLDGYESLSVNAFPNILYKKIGPLERQESVYEAVDMTLKRL